MINFAVGMVLYNLVDDGISNVLEDQTFRHGTNPVSYFWIMLGGGDPAYGGDESGSSGEYHNNTQHFFYVIKDSAFDSGYSSNRLMDKINSLHFIWKRVLPRWHVAASGFYLITRKVFKLDKKDSPTCIQALCGILSALGGVLITPTIRFRFSHIDPDRFEHDNDYFGAAYKTQQKVEFWRAGIFGSLLTGLNFGWFDRVQANPAKFLTGVVQLTCAVGLSILARNIIIANPYAAIPILVGGLLA